MCASEETRTRLREVRHGQAIYAAHVAALLAPGVRVPSVRGRQIEPGSLEDWIDAELELMVDEGRRQVDRQLQDLDRTRNRSQWLLTLALAALAALATGFARTGPTGPDAVAWVVGMAALTWGVAGAAAVMVIRAEFRQISTTLLSSTETPVLRSLAEAYARMTGLGEECVATRITVFRQAVLFSIIGGYISLVAALLA
jgi:hypothetical protein